MKVCKTHLLANWIRDKDVWETNESIVTYMEKIWGGLAFDDEDVYATRERLNPERK